jgi:hypothetical protein
LDFDGIFDSEQINELLDKIDSRLFI